MQTDCFGIISNVLQKLTQYFKCQIHWNFNTFGTKLLGMTNLSVGNTFFSVSKLKKITTSDSLIYKVLLPLLELTSIYFRLKCNHTWGFKAFPSYWKLTLYKQSKGDSHYYKDCILLLLPNASNINITFPFLSKIKDLFSHYFAKLGENVHLDFVIYNTELNRKCQKFLHF